MSGRGVPRMVISSGAVLIEAGLWLRARYYPQKPGDTMYDCYVREAEVTRNNVALVDVTTLGKIDIQGPDASEFLNRLYINNWLKLPIGQSTSADSQRLLLAEFRAQEMLDHHSGMQVSFRQ